MIKLNTKISKALFCCVCNQSAVLSLFFFMPHWSAFNEYERVGETMPVGKVVWHFDKDKWNNAVRFAIVMHRFSEFIQFVGRQWKIAFVHTSLNSKVKVFHGKKHMAKYQKKNAVFSFDSAFVAICCIVASTRIETIECWNWWQCMAFNAYSHSHTSHIAILFGNIVFTDFLHAVSLLRQLETGTEHASVNIQISRFSCSSSGAVARLFFFFHSPLTSCAFLCYAFNTRPVRESFYVFVICGNAKAAFNSFSLPSEQFILSFAFHTYARHDKLRKL